jgi:hypothetical protein
MVVIHTAYVTLKMSGPNGVITIKVDQRDILAYENTTLTNAGRFGKKNGPGIGGQDSEDARR